MSKLLHTRTINGIWEGVMSLERDSAAPYLQVTHRETPIPDVSLQAVPDQPGNWQLSFPIPTSCLSDTIETLLISDVSTGEVLGSYTVMTGSDTQVDVRAELDLLRAELDMLKRAFRRHCRETMP